MKKLALLSLFFFFALSGFAQITPVSADLGFSDAHLEDLSGNLINANLISYNQVVKIKVNVHNFSQTDDAPSGHFRIKIGLGSGMMINPTFDLTHAALSAYFTWTYDNTQAQPQIIGNSIQTLPADFYGTAAFEIKAATPGTSTVSYNFLIANPPNTTTPLSDPDGSNNVAANQYTIAEQLTFTQLTQNVSCYGAANGSIAVTPAGGVPDPNYTFTIVNTTTNVTSTLSSNTTVTFTNLAPGNYNITVTDPYGNTATGTTAITQPNALIANASAPPVACYGGTTTLTVNAGGGTPLYTYSLNGNTPQSSNTFTVSAGDYVVGVKDANYCTVQTSSVHIENPAPVAAPTGSTTQTFCNSATIGDLMASGQNINWYNSSTGGSPVVASTALANGNHYYASQTIGGCESPTRLDVTVAINTSPSFTSCPSNVSVNADNNSCAAVVNYILATSGSPMPTYSYVFSDATSGSGSGTGSGSSFNTGITTVTITASNACSSATCTFTVTVADNQNPTITAPAALNLDADAGQCQASGVSLGTPVTADNCGVQSVTNDAPLQFPVGQTIVTWTVTDVHGNRNTATQLVTITDNQNPTITAPAAINAFADPGQCSANGLVLGTPVTSDNCGVQSVTNDATAPFQVGVTIVTWKVIDIHGNSNTATQTVTVTDNQNPTITAPANINTSPNSAGCSATVTLGTPVTADNCGVQNVTNNAPASFPLGTTTVTWTVTDIHNNTNTATQTVTVTSTLNATASYATNTIACHGGTTTLSVNVTDGSSPFMYSLDNGTPQNSNTFTVAAGTHTVIVTDANGCTTSVTKSISEPSGTRPDITVSVADYTDNFFPAPTVSTPNPEVTLIYQIIEVGGNPALMDTLSITKQSGYAYTFLSGSNATVSGANYTIDNNRWTVDNSNAGLYRILINNGQQIGCGQSVYLAVKITRTNGNKSAFPLSSFGRLRWVANAPEETNQTNNATTIVLVGQ